MELRGYLEANERCKGTQSSRKQRQTEPQRPNKSCESQTCRVTFAPSVASIISVFGPEVFVQGYELSFHCSVPHRRHLYKRLSDLMLIGPDRDVCVVLKCDVTTVLCERCCEEGRGLAPQGHLAAKRSTCMNKKLLPLLFFPFNYNWNYYTCIYFPKTCPTSKQQQKVAI